MKKLMLTGLTAVMLSTGAFASEVTGYTDATANTPATAADINANFAALIAAINDNNSRIAALESGGVSSDVSGKVFTYQDLGLILAAQNGVQSDAYGRVGYFVGQFQISFFDNNTYTLVGTDLDTEVDVNPSAAVRTFSQAVNESGTWSQNGTTVTLTPSNDEPFTLTVSAAGDILVVSETGGPFGDGQVPETTEYEANLGVGIVTGEAVLP